jgi:hypothetical protein
MLDWWLQVVGSFPLWGAIHQVILHLAVVMELNPLAVYDLHIGQQLLVIVVSGPCYRHGLHQHSQGQRHAVLTEGAAPPLHLVLAGL